MAPSISRSFETDGGETLTRSRDRARTQALGLGSRLLADTFAPSGSAHERASFAAFQRNSASAEIAADLLELTSRPMFARRWPTCSCRRSSSIAGATAESGLPPRGAAGGAHPERRARRARGDAHLPRQAIVTTCSPRSCAGCQSSVRSPKKSPNHRDVFAD